MNLQQLNAAGDPKDLSIPSSNQLQGHFDLEVAKDKVGKQAASISPHPHGADGRLQPV